MAGQGLAGPVMAGAFWLAMTVAAHATDDYSKLWKQGDPQPCFEVAQTTSQQDDPPTILVNRCTGETWALVKVGSFNAAGKVTGYKLQWVLIPRPEP